ncbi:hypothetical protein M011DRAFT_413752, partial [Sporormia fimetaria CBS 119925]
PLLWINAFPGTGKLTIANELPALLPEHSIHLIDNHQMIDAKITLQRRIAIPHDHLHRCSCIDFQSDNELGAQVAQEYKTAAREAGRPFLPIYLECGLVENMRRMTHAQRVSSGTGKLVDVEMLADMRSRCRLYRFEDIVGLNVDVSGLEAREAAASLACLIREWEQSEK